MSGVIERGIQYERCTVCGALVPLSQMEDTKERTRCRACVKAGLVIPVYGVTGCRCPGCESVVRGS